mgnify:CR=1 FL=1
MKLNSLNAILFALLVAALGFLFLSTELDAKIKTSLHQMDSIAVKCDSIIASNDSIKVKLNKLEAVNDSLTKSIDEKKGKVVEFKELRDENSRIVYSSADSSIVRILTEHEFKALSKR